MSRYPSGSGEENDDPLPRPFALPTEFPRPDGARLWRREGSDHKLIEEGYERNRQGLCRNCGKPLTDKRKSYCDGKCVDEWWDKTNWNHIRSKVLQRDEHTCRRCGKTEEQLALIRAAQEKRGYWAADLMHRLTVHHILPIEYGGNEFDPENCITYCQRCHIKVHRVLKRKQEAQKKKIRTLDVFV